MPKHDTALVEAPSLGLLTTEPLRTAYEYAMTRFRTRRSTGGGDGHPVVIFPGLATDERFIEPLRAHCEQMGYSAKGWGRGFNVGPKGDVDAWLNELATEVRAVAGRNGRASLIGWSLGGIYAREIAKLVPGSVRRVITIGSPFAGLPNGTNAGWLFRLLNREAVMDDELAGRLRTPPPVPTTSIYSRKDGVVAWQACRDDAWAHVENVEVDSSHMGLVWHPDVLDLVAARLSVPAKRRARSDRRGRRGQRRPR